MAFYSNCLSVDHVFDVIGLMGPACALIGASYTGCDRVSTFSLVVRKRSTVLADPPDFNITNIIL